MVRREIEKDIVPICLEKNIGILAYSPMQRGLLTGKFKPGHVFREGDSRPDTAYYKEPNFSEIMKFLEKIKPVAEGYKATLSQLVLNWTIQQPGITCALAGARNAEQTMENIGAANFNISSSDISLINTYLSEMVIDTNI
jgi:aryl-alcohol dehydrogenase-like predicted oxidoreductase